jgi:hypothetical protein
VLGGDRTAERNDKGEHRVLVTAVRGPGGNDVDVHVAVGDVAERDDPRAGIRLGDHAGCRGREPRRITAAARP